MRTLVVLRHGKSDWSTGLPDRERPLARRGLRQAPESGAWIADHLAHLDLAVVSPATRARQTWDLVAAELTEPPPVQVEETVYAAWGEKLLALVRELPDDARTVALVGHNPSLEELVDQISGRWPEMKTSAVAVLRWEGDWSEAGRAPAELVAHGRPPGDPVPPLTQETP